MKAPHPAAVAPHRGYSGVGTEIVSKNLAEDAEDNTSEDSEDKTEFKVCCHEYSLSWSNALYSDLCPAAISHYIICMN